MQEGLIRGNDLLRLAMECVTAEIRIVLLFLKTTGSVQTLFVAGRCVTGYGLPFGNRFGAFEGNDVAWHKIKFF